MYHIAKVSIQPIYRDMIQSPTDNSDNSAKKSHQDDTYYDRHKCIMSFIKLILNRVDEQRQKYYVNG